MNVASLAGLLIAGLILSLSACSFVPQAQRPEAVRHLPSAFTQSPPDSIRLQQAWWETFNDPVLNQLVDTALYRNLDLKMAAARVKEVQNRYRISRAELFPSVQATLSGNRQSTPTNTGATGQFSENIPDFSDRFDVTTYSASLGFSYEIDFWGRVRSSKNAALHEFFATEADLETARIGVLSETIATYFEIIELEQSLTLNEQNADLLAERVALTEDRYRRGLVTSFELYSVRQTFEDLRASLPLLERRHYDAKGRLALVLGLFPAAAEALLGEMHPSLNPVPIPAGLPSTLLERRPDVMAAALRMEAQRQRIGVARADRFPRLSLTASGGTQSSELTDLVQTSQHFWTLGSNLVAPIFSAGALKANVEVAWARYEQSTAAYEKTVLTAFKEVEAALQAYQKEQERYAFLEEARANAEASAETQEQRYRRGVGDYLAFVDAQINLVRVQTTLVSAERALASARLAIHRALGGAWI